LTTITKFTKEKNKEGIKVKEIKVKGKRELITMAEWKDIKDIVKEDLRKYKDFYAELEEL